MKGTKELIRLGRGSSPMSLGGDNHEAVCFFASLWLLVFGAYFQTLSNLTVQILCSLESSASLCLVKRKPNVSFKGTFRV